MKGRIEGDGYADGGYSLYKKDKHNPDGSEAMLDKARENIGIAYESTKKAYDKKNS